MEPQSDDTATIDETTTTSDSEAETAARYKALLALANDRFKQAYDAHRDDFDECAKVQEFIAGDQWPPNIKSARESDDRPCLTLDKLKQYHRHLVNNGLLRARDVRVLAMSGEADDEVADVLAGLIRQITQTSTAKYAYETGLRHATGTGRGYWRVKVEAVPNTNGELLEIHIIKVRDPRMVLIDPFCDYPDARDAKYGFLLTKLTKKEFTEQYGQEKSDAVKSWHLINSNNILPWVSVDAVVVAEYYYYEGETMYWAILTPDQVLSEGVHHGNVMPLIRVLGDEYEHQGKERARGVYDNSSMDAQRAYNYAASASIENAALAPLAPWVAAAGQTEKYVNEWKDSNKVPRAVLRYEPITVSGQLAPPPQRAQPAGVPEGWQAMMSNLIQDIQMSMGVAQPNVLGTGGIPVQSGAGIDAQKDPGDINTFHFIDHWHGAIEQTGRVILAMIPHVYTKPQAVKIVGDEGDLETALLNPAQESPVVKAEVSGRVNPFQRLEAYDKALSQSYNPMIGRYDVAISTGPATSTKKAAASALMQTMVQAYPAIMDKAGDLVVKTIDAPGADVLAKRLKAFLPPGIAEDDEGEQLAMLQQLSQENQAMKAQLGELQQIILGEREQAQAKLIQAGLQAHADLTQSQQQGAARLIEERLKHEGDTRIASLKAQVELENNTRDNIVKVIIEQIRAHNKLDVKIFEHLSQAAHQANHEARMSGYMDVLQSLANEPPAAPMATELSAPMA